MNRDEILEIAREVGLVSTYTKFDDWIEAGPSGDELMEFVKQIAKKIRFEAADDAWIELVRHQVGWQLRKAVTDAIHARDEQ
jgi:hypothetical protein